MGSFSFMYADGGRKGQANMVPGDRVRVLIPSVFGGGALEGEYADYGNIVLAGDTVVDVYELVALWNSAELRAAAAKVLGVPALDAACKMVGDRLTPFARAVGIRVACYDEDMVRLSCPLRVVPTENEDATYESVEGVSVVDPNQGFEACPWSDLGWGESLAVYLDGLRAQNEREGREPWGDVALTDDERERVDELCRTK